jgi:hypothetical protein
MVPVIVPQIGIDASAHPVCFDSRLVEEEP